MKTLASPVLTLVFAAAILPACAQAGEVRGNEGSVLQATPVAKL